MSRKILLLIIAMLGLIYYTSEKPSEISDKVMVHAIGIDERKDGYHLTMQIFTPEGSGAQTPIDPSSPNVSIIKGKGKTVSEAAEDCEHKLGGDVFLGQNRIILFGKDTDLSRHDELFGFFTSSGEAFMNVDCACAENSAEELLSVPLESGSVASERFTRMISSGKSTGCCASCTLTELMLSMNENSSTAILPLFSAQKEKNSKDKLKSRSPIAIEKGALYVKGMFSGEISCEEMALCAVLNGTGNHIRLENNNAESSETVYEIRSRSVSAETENGIPVFRIRLQAVPDRPNDSSDPKTRNKKSMELNRLLTERSQMLADKLCGSETADILGTQRYLRRFYPALVRKYKNTPDLLTGCVKIKIEVL